MSRLEKAMSPAALIISVLALLVATSAGSAYAAAKISTSQIKNNAITTPKIKNNAVTGAKIKNGTIGTADLSVSARGALKGAKGSPGAPGAPGTPGTPGLSGYQLLSAESPETDADGWTVVSVDCPAGQKALGHGVSWRNTASSTMTQYSANTNVTLKPNGSGYNAYGNAAGTGAWLTLQVACATVAP